MFPPVRKPLRFSFSTATPKSHIPSARHQIPGPFYTGFNLFIILGGKAWGGDFFLFLFQSLIVLQQDCQLLYYQPNCFRKKKKKNYKKNFFKGTLLKAGRAKIELASCVLVCGTCLHMTGTWKYHTSRWQLAVHVSRGFCCGFL